MIKPFPKFEHIHALATPLPVFPDLITANLYAVGKGPVTLIDTGPKLPGSLEFVQKQLKLVGFDLNDVNRIIITHGHVDHFGLAASIRNFIGHPVECFIHSEDKWRISSENMQAQMWSEEVENWMAMAGMPPKEIQKVRHRFSFFTELCDPLDQISTIEDGDEFSGDGYHLKVIHTPGHTTGNICLYESCQKILFSGDHILKHISPNPLAEITRSRLQDPTYQSLKAYVTSLDKFSGLDVRFVFPGHGEYIEDVAGIISTYKALHRQRMEAVWKALNKNTRPLYHLIENVFPYVPEGDLFLAISEILVHLEILINQERAERVELGPPALYRAL